MLYLLPTLLKIEDIVEMARFLYSKGTKQNVVCAATLFPLRSIAPFLSFQLLSKFFSAVKNSCYLRPEVKCARAGSKID